MTSAPEQKELFDLADIAGYSVLTKRERLFVHALFEGRSQREAAKSAGFNCTTEGSLDAAASRAIRNDKVQALMQQAWQRSGANIDTVLRQCAEIVTRAFHEWQQQETAERRAAARKEWRDAAVLLASIHGKLQLKISGAVQFTVVSDADRAHLESLNQAFVRRAAVGGVN